MHDYFSLSGVLANKTVFVCQPLSLNIHCTLLTHGDGQLGPYYYNVGGCYARYSVYTFIIKLKMIIDDSSTETVSSILLELC